MQVNLSTLLKLPLLVLALAALHTTPARADMWGYVDAQGVTHFSALQLDERYELFFRGGENFNAGAVLPPAALPASPAPVLKFSPPRKKSS